MLPDGSEEKMRRLRYTGPGAVLVTAAHEQIESSGPLGGPRLRLRELPEHHALTQGQVIALARNIQMRVG